MGGPRGVGVQFNAGRAITVPRGAAVSIRIRVVRSDGVAFLVAGLTVRVAVRKNARSMPIVLRVATPAPLLGPDWVTCDLVADDTRGAEPGVYAWDAWLTDTKQPIVPTSNFTLSPSQQEVA